MRVGRIKGQGNVGVIIVSKLSISSSCFWGEAREKGRSLIRPSNRLKLGDGDQPPHINPGGPILFTKHHQLLQHAPDII